MASEPKIYLDACCFIDLAKQSKAIALTPEKTDGAWFSARLLEASRDSKIKIYTSGFTQVECIGVKEKDEANSPMIFDAEVRRLFESILSSGKSGVIPVEPGYFITKAARDLYWDHGVFCKPPDRLHLATAISVGCSEFLTVDGRINQTQRKLVLKNFGLSVISPRETKVLPSEYRQLRIDQHDDSN